MKTAPTTNADKADKREDESLDFLRRVYREFYFRHPDMVESPASIAQREFGYVQFGGGMVRHLSYGSKGELAAELVKQAPSSVFCSNARYLNPTLPMEEKGWEGAELIFDLDATAIPTPCKSKHSFWLCHVCGESTKGVNRPARCSRCNATDLSQVHWSCGECLAATKEHVTRLIDFLVKDFGVSGDDIRIYFSGSRGYHLHVSDKRFEALDSASRAEIANYVKGTGLVLVDHHQQKKPTRYGWSTRIFDAITSIPSSNKRNSPKLLAQIVSTYGALIDESVTTDIHRVFRMPGTLHGDSGLLKTRVHNLDAFQPETDPVVLNGEKVNIFVRFAPEFRLNGTKFGPYASSEIALPTYAAVFLLAKGLGSVAVSAGE